MFNLRAAKFFQILSVCVAAECRPSKFGSPPGRPVLFLVTLQLETVSARGVAFIALFWILQAVE